MSTPADPSVAAAPAADLLDTPEAGRRVVRGGAVRIVGFGAGLIASVAASRLLAAHLGPEQLGSFVTVVGMTTVIQVVSELGTGVLGLREYAQRHGADRDAFMRTLLGLRIGITAVGIAAAVLASLALGYDRDRTIGAALMALGFAISSFYGTLSIPLQAELRVGLVTAIDVARQILLALLYVVLVAAGAGLVPFLGAPIPIYVLLTFVTLWFVRGAVPLRPTFHPRAWAGLVRPTLTVALATSVGGLYLYTAVVLIDQVSTPYETGIFGASFRVYVIAASVPALLMTVAFPVLSRAARDDASRLAYAAQRLFEASALVGFLALIGCVLGAEPIIAVVAGPQFTDAEPVLRVQGTALAVTFVIASWGFTILALHLHRPMVFANLAALVVSAVTVALLGHHHGALGAAFGTLFGECALATGYAIALARRGPELRPRFGLIVRALPALGLGLACWFLPIPPVLSTVAGLVVYAALLLPLGAIPNEIRDHLPGPLRAIGPSLPDREVPAP